MGAFVLVALLTAAEPKVIGPREAVRLAAHDLAALKIPLEHKCFIRYAWLERPDPLKTATFVYAANTGFNHAGSGYPCEIVADGYLVRMDVRRFVTEKKDLIRFLDLWENKLAFTEPYTHNPNIVIGRNGGLFRKLQCPAYTADDGKVYSYTTVAINRAEQFAEHTGLPDMLLLHSLTDSNMPLARYDWLENVATTTLQVGLTKGLYYDFRGIRGLNQAQILALFDADEKASDQNNADSRAAILFSGVTGRSRRMDAFFGRAVRPTAGIPILTLSHDLDHDDVLAEQDPILNILNARDTAREGVFVLANGFLFFVLFDGNGVLQDFVPDQVAHDSTVPHPHPQTLVPGVSCLACHGPQGGFIDHDNDIQHLYRARLAKALRGDVFDDLSSKKDVHDTLDIAASKYKGDLNTVYAIARAFHGATTKSTTGYTVPEVTAELVRSRNAYVFGRIDVRQALYELGHDIEPQGETEHEQLEHMTDIFAQVVPPPEIDPEVGYSEEHGLILALRNTRKRLTLSRAQWESIFPELADRAYEALEKQE